MTVYNVYAESLQSKINDGLITFEEANKINDKIYAKTSNIPVLDYREFPFTERDEVIIDTCVEGFITFESALEMILEEKDENTKEELTKDEEKEIKTSNTVYVKTFQKACKDYNKSLSKLKDYYARRDEKKFDAGLEECKEKLKRISEIIDECPEHLKPESFQHLKSLLAGLVIGVAFGFLQSLATKDDAKNGETYKEPKGEIFKQALVLGTFTAATKEISMLARYAKYSKYFKKYAKKDVSLEIVYLAKLERKFYKEQKYIQKFGEHKFSKK